MALFTDGAISSIEDLTAQDSQLLNVASVEGIDVTQKIGLAQEQVAMDLIGALKRFGWPDALLWQSPRPQLDMVVVTPPLKLWHSALSLNLFYADAYNSQLNDRYAGRRDQFQDLARWAYAKLIEIGLGIAGTPLPKPPVPTVTPFPGTLSDNLYYVAMAWVNQAGQEGAPATATTIATTSSTFLVEPEPAPAAATGWNVYIGLAPDTMYLQNSSPLSTGQTWEQPGSLVQTGKLPGKGQMPDYLQPLPRILQRG